MIEELIAMNNLAMPIPQTLPEQEELLDALRTISVPSELSDDYYQAETRYLLEKSASKVVISVDDINEKLMENVYIYQGDITTIQADAIVNAANEKMLGCFIPGHRCIDNAIHMAAGLHLRNECHSLMVTQGHDEPVGLAKVTKGYHLPSSYVVHTVGPNRHTITAGGDDEIRQGLRHCYLSILEAVASYEDIRTLVFCSISTGVYGVSIEMASEIALETIQQYLQNEDHHLAKVVINVFSEGDYNVYKHQAKQFNS